MGFVVSTDEKNEQFYKALAKMYAKKYKSVHIPRKSLDYLMKQCKKSGKELLYFLYLVLRSASWTE